MRRCALSASSPSSNDPFCVSTIRFNARLRRGDTRSIPGRLGETIKLRENIDYLVSFTAPLSVREKTAFVDIGADFFDETIALVNFGNFAGKASIAGVSIDVESAKLGSGGVSKLLEDISQISSALIFSVATPTELTRHTSMARSAAVPYHQLQLLRRVMMLAMPGERLQDWLTTIARTALRRFEPERPLVAPDRVRRLDARAIRSIFSRLDRIVRVPEGSLIASNALAEGLTFGDPPTRHFPAKIAAPRGRLSFDTPENRFIRHVASTSLGLVYQFIRDPRLHDGLRADCNVMAGLLSEALRAPHLADAGPLTAFGNPSQSLTKMEGYRDTLLFWSDLTRGLGLPASGAETHHLLEGRDLASLYEYWVFVKIVEALVTITGQHASKLDMIRRDEYGEFVKWGFILRFPFDISVSYNLQFSRGSSLMTYSTPLRPDVVVKLGTRLHVFDAKYRMSRLDSGKDVQDDDDGDVKDGTYKRDDLYKMHSYRDAIQDVRTAFAVYPGSEFVFFERKGARRTRPVDIGNFDGVGAIPLRPSDDRSGKSLDAILRMLLNSSSLSP
jgi:predicted component of viral defense system (DUF524 family)